MEVEDAAGPAPIGLWRLFGCVVYDGLVLLALWMAGTALLLPFTGGEAVRPDQPLYPAYLIAIAIAYLGWFWTHGGQTLGMRAWRCRLVSLSSPAVDWTQALTRFLGAGVSWLALGAGFAWLLVDPDRRTWHDRLSGTAIVDASAVD